MKALRKKVPFIMQLEALECGAACLGMVLAHYGRWVTLPELRERLGVSRDGVNALSILKAARSYGLSGGGFRWKTETLRKKAESGEAALPCILFWRNNHFVVLTGISKKGARMNDPAIGPITVPWDAFEESYSDVAMPLKPGPAFERAGKPSSVLAFARERLANSGHVLAFLSLAGIAAAGLSVIQPALASSFVDKVLSGANTAWLAPLLVALLALAAVQSLLLAANASYQITVQAKFAVSANCSYMRHVMRLPMQFFSQRMAGDICARQKSNATVAQTLMATLVPVGVGVIAMAAYLAMMLSISPALTMVGLSALALDVVVAHIISRKRVQLSRSVARDGGNLSGTTTSILSVMETIKASGAEDGVFQQWTGAQATVMAGQARIARVNAYWGAMPQLLMDMANALLLALGAVLIMQGSITSGMLLALQGLLQQFVKPAQQVIAAGQKVIEMRTDMERIEDVTRYPQDALFAEDGKNGENAPSKLEESPSGRISMRNVTFGYSPLAEPLLRDFSLELKPGEVVALVGPSGCGKSTIAKLISGVHLPWSGEILFDGLALTAYDRAAFTSAVGVVDQDILLLAGSVKDNFRFADATISEAAMMKAAKDAQVHEAILKHPGGYDGLLAEGGRNFSGGQRQQLEIARVLAGNPSVLVLDEATSALDAQTEARVMQAIKERGATTVVVAHRLSTIRDADKIVVLDNGRIAEQGTHDDLMELGEIYAKLVSAA